MNKKKGISIRYKLFILLTTLPVLTLALYLGLATRLFRLDKIAYVFDSSVSVTRSLAAQARVEINLLMNLLNPVLEGLDITQADFSSTAKRLFEKNENLFYIHIFSLNSEGQFVPVAELIKGNNGVDPQKEQILLNKARQDGIGLYASDSVGFASSKPSGDSVGLASSKSSGEQKPELLFLAFKYSSAGIGNPLIVLVQIKAKNFMSIFQQGSTQQSYLAEKSGQVVIGPDYSLKNFSSWKFFSEINRTQFSEGTMEAQAPEGKELLASYSKIGQHPFYVISLVEKSHALKAMQTLLWKSIFFFVALISFATLISVFASKKITSTLRELYVATKQVAEGKFNIQVNIHSQDEVGSLADSFNKMASEIARLIVETAAKARMEKELETAKTVQETLFPAPHAQLGPLKIAAYFEPASECGGDWWHYSEIDEKIFLWLGDATGHGAPAALITSAAKSVASVLEHLSPITPAIALDFLNRAIYETSKGKILMAFFLAAFDKKTRELVYANASHDPPFLIKNTEGVLDRKNIIPLNAVNNPRLGEKSDLRYKETKIILDPGDTLFFYTDGALDIESKSGKKWTERLLIKSVLNAMSNSSELDGTIDLIHKNIEEFREGTELKDDLTMFLCQYDKAA